MEKLKKQRKKIENMFNELSKKPNKTDDELEIIKSLVRELKKINKTIKRYEDLYNRYEIGTKVTFENMYDDKIRTGIITKHNEKFPTMYEVTCDSDRVWFVSVDMVKVVEE